MVQVRLEDDWRVFQVDVNVNKKPHEVYSALCQVLDVKSTPAEPCYLECNGVVVTQHNVCQLLRAGCIVRLCRGVPPADAGGEWGSASSPVRGRTPRSGRRIHTPSGYATARLWPHDVDMAGEEPHADPVSRGGVGARPYTSGEGEPPAPAANGHSTLQRTLSIPQDSAGQGQPSPSPRRRTSSFAMGWGATGQARPSGHSSRVSARLYRPKTGAMAAQEAEERARRGSMSGGRLGASLGGASFNKGRTGRALNITVEAPKGGIGGGGKTLPFAAAQVHIPELDMYNSEKAAMDDLTDWLDSFEEEQASYNSTVLLAQVRMEEALKNTKGMGIPNTVRTKVVTQLMNAILAKFGRFRDITGLLFSELMLSVYQAPEERDAEPYFLKYDRLKQDYHTLEAQQTLLQRELKQSEAKSNNRMAYARRTMANMLKRSLKQGFLLWKDGVEAKKNSRRQLAKIVKRWRQLDIMRAFDQWRQAVYEIREKRMLGKLEEQEKSIDGLGARNLQLEEELERERRARDEALRMLEEERKKQQWMLDEMARLKADLEEANRKIQDSREDEFRELATEYKGVLAAHWEAELAELREKCDSMTYHDPGRLLAVNENMDSLYQVDKQELIVRWMNVHLKANGMEDVMNLSTDLRDGKELVLLNHLADPTRASLKWLKEVDPQRVAMRVLEDACTLFNFPRGVLEDDGSSITKSIGDLCYNLAAHMFEYHPMLHRNFSEGATVDALKELQDTIQDFNRTSATDGVSEGYPRQLMSKMKEIRALVAATDAEGKSAEERLRYLACEARSFGIHMLGARIAGEPMELQDARMGEEVIAYTKLNRFKVSDLLPMSDESDAELHRPTRDTRARIAWSVLSSPLSAAEDRGASQGVLQGQQAHLQVLRAGRRHEQPGVLEIRQGLQDAGQEVLWRQVRHRLPGLQPRGGRARPHQDQLRGGGRRQPGLRAPAGGADGDAAAHLHGEVPRGHGGGAPGAAVSGVHYAVRVQERLGGVPGDVGGQRSTGGAAEAPRQHAEDLHQILGGGRGHQRGSGQVELDERQGGGFTLQERQPHRAGRGLHGPQEDLRACAGRGRQRWG
mmetsp:Transcript_34875/g.110163  ORF Transcript_34875/g.110163 Transcript_34875/m.110163 type:complete len:1080 (-) Transcript_34875:312-3551(-)